MKFDYVRVKFAYGSVNEDDICYVRVTFDEI
jgi:hypothetical protein